MPLFCTHIQVLQVCLEHKGFLVQQVHVDLMGDQGRQVGREQQDTQGRQVLQGGLVQWEEMELLGGLVTLGCRAVMVGSNSTG